MLDAAPEVSVPWLTEEEGRRHTDGRREWSQWMKERGSSFGLVVRVFPPAIALLLCLLAPERPADDG